MTIRNSSQEPSTAPAIGVYRALLYGLVVLLAVACSPSVDKQGSAGEWLVDLNSVYCSALPVASFSADKDWMLFWIRHFRGDPSTGSRTSVMSPALLQFESRRLVLPAGPADRSEGLSFSPSSLCWDDAEKGVYVRGSGRRAATERPWYRAELKLDSELVPVASPPESCRQPLEVEWQSHRDPVIPNQARGDLEIIRDGCCAVELRRRSDGLLLARHEARSALSDLVMVSRYAWSESMTRLAYRVSEEISWWFGRPARSFVVERRGQPTPLRGQVFAFVWRGDDELIACAGRSSDGSDGRGTSLKLWRFETAHH
ncbi:hypothetical protein [Ectothiorhodospira variabilis]|uniref:hypothetical protein n=1 Tax=Ectothiorhodospira variabilis TaxID=505694 RepID=UPI001EFBFCCE|nr:hypothetical protein [Ectothiorhodospira variabilis]MCG5494934.1 hypothetical protein [Ectothiorhodospira variabilis]MCG5504447.1 hypothetical protein [Ectothiorhodospira variabilis]MCG5507602.1 hypothetical protein [Ectothiorhodospira variabilis]